MAISALDDSGKSVEWWFAYKVPQIGGAGPGSAIGYDYVYYDPNIGRVITSPHTMTMDKDALGGRLESLFHSPSENTGWILYNDERPDAAKTHPDQNDDGSLGHPKGILAFDT